MPANQELPVYPMTARDEITYRTPDALFNGSAVVEVIQSCVPNIRNAWHIPSIDLDSVLIAVRIASFGHEINIGSRCPSCEHQDDYAVDLRYVNEKISTPNWDRSLKLGDLELYFKPLSYQQINANNLSQFEQQKMLANLDNAEVDNEVKNRTMSEALKTLTNVTLKALANSISVIRTPQSLVNDAVQIEEWLNNCDRRTFNQIRDFVLEIRRGSEMPPLKMKCHNCSHEYDQMFTLDMTTFFGDAS